MTTKRTKTQVSSLHRDMIRAFVADVTCYEWMGVVDSRLAQNLGRRHLRKAHLSTKQTRDLIGEEEVRILAAAWDGLGNIFALLPNGQRVQFIGR